MTSQPQPTLTDIDLERYQRHLQLPNFGRVGQAKLSQAHVVIVEVGGLGCPVALYLAAAGVGQITLVDGDEVSLSNLQRQVLFTEANIGSNKAVAAAEHLTQRNSQLQITAIAHTLTDTNAVQILQPADLVIDCSDNFYARYLINDTCHQHDTAWIYASVLQQQGQVALLQPQYSCFRCLFPQLNSALDCNQAGVLGVLPGMLGSMQASLAMQYLSGVNLPANNQLTRVNNWPLQVRTIELAKAPNCKLCHGHATAEELQKDYHARPTADLARQQLSAQDLADLQRSTNVMLIDVRQEEEHKKHNIGGTNIPLSRLKTELIVQAKATYVFYCQTGKRSLYALEQLIADQPDILNHCQLYSLKGGTEKL
ncbi:MAG TPA: hypothetical protein DE179_04510 [Oceanospirillaceae bacterium]|nr:hypothetical protein [Oceanospirillaceae bacterium]